MGMTLLCTFVGIAATDKIASFNGHDVRVTETHKIIDNATFKNLMVFWKKKDAVEFCKRWGFIQKDITKVESRWQMGYAIGLGREYFAPRQAEARLIAHRMGYLVNGVDYGTGADREIDIKTDDGLYVPLDGNVA